MVTREWTEEGMKADIQGSALGTWVKGGHSWQGEHSAERLSLQCQWGIQGERDGQGATGSWTSEATSNTLLSLD